jgi:hypothetical protein
VDNLALNRGEPTHIGIARSCSRRSKDSSTLGEAALRGHLIGDSGKEQTGSQSYVPADPKEDKALQLQSISYTVEG